MPFNIQTFKSVLNGNDGILRNNYFEVVFLPPPILNGSFEGAMFQELSFYAEQVGIPGVNLSSHDVRRYGYGPIEKRPIGHTFTDCNMTFIHDAKTRGYDVFYKWIMAVSPFNMSNGIDTPVSTTGSQNRPPFLMNYKSDYITDLQIRIFNGQGKYGDTPVETSESQEPIMVVILKEAFPISLADQQFAWSEMNNYARYTIQFAYHDWHIED